MIKTEKKDFDFHFKKEKIKDASGNTIGEGKKHPSFKAALPCLTADSVLEIVQAGGKDLQLLLEVANSAIFDYAKQIIADIREKQPDVTVTAEMLLAREAELAWNFIANIEPKQRTSSAPSEEDIDAFNADYKAIMPAATGKDVERIEKHCSIFKRKFANIKNDKKALAIMQDMLSLWATTTSQMDDMQDVYSYFSRRVESLLKEEEKILADAL